MKVVIFANTDWYLYNFRRSTAKAVQALGHEVLMLSPPGPFGSKLIEMGLRWVALHMDRGSLNPIRELAVIWRLVRLFRAERPDLVHSFTVKCAIYGSIAARLAGVPARVNAVAGLGYVFASSDLKARLLRPLVRAMMRVALAGKTSSLVLQNPDDVALFAREAIVDPGKIRLIPGSGVDCSSFRPRGTDVSPGPFCVLLASRLLWDKGIAEFVQAAQLLKDEGRQIIFLLAGTPDAGNPGSVPEGVVRKWADDGVVEWLGHVDDMPSLLTRVNAFVLPSFYREGLPKSLIEAAVCQLPLITTDMPGCRDVVTDGVDGLLVPTRDAGALARAIARLADDPLLAARLGSAARRKALAQFDERIVIRRTIETYGELLGSALGAAVYAEGATGRM